MLLGKRKNTSKEMEVRAIANQKQRVSRHNGRAGKHGVYNSKHNDRQFDVAHADNIDGHRTRMNLYWDWQNGLRTHEENQSGQYPTFPEVEHEFYEQRYGDFLNGQAARNAKAGHSKRNRTVKDLLDDSRICPEESIYQIGKEGDCPPADVLLAIVQEFMATIESRYGTHVHMLDWALHLDETSPHIHARQVFDVTNRYGEIEPKQEKALQELGIPLPYPEKAPSRTNNRKITFDRMCRQLLLDICEQHGLEVETEAIYGGKANRDKNDYIIESQRAKIAELERRNEELTADNIRQSRLLEQKAAELDEKLDQLADADAVLDSVADIAYDEALKVATQMAIEQTQKEDVSAISKVINGLDASSVKLKQKEKDVVRQWLNDARSAITKTARSIFSTVMNVLRKPEYRRVAKEKVKESARPTVKDLLWTYASEHTQDSAARRNRGYDAR